MENRHIFWRTVLTGILVILISIVLDVEVIFLMLLWAILLSASFFIINDKSMLKIVNTIMSDEFEKKYKIIYKCFIFVVSFTAFSALIILVGYYRLSESAPKNLVIMGLFIFYSIVAYLIKDKNLFFCKKEK